MLHQNDLPAILAAFEYHRAALERHSARHNLMLGLLPRLVNMPAADVRLWTFDTPGSCALQLGERNIVLGELRCEDLPLVAATALPLPFCGIVGPEEAAQELARLCEVLGEVFLPPTAQVGLARALPCETLA